MSNSKRTSQCLRGSADALRNNGPGLHPQSRSSGLDFPAVV